MPTYTITGPDGRSYNVNAPEGASAQDAAEYLNRKLSAQLEAQSQAKAPVIPEFNQEDSEKRLQDIINSAPVDRSAWGSLTSGISRGARQTGSLLGDVLPALGASALGFDDYAKRQMDEAKAVQEDIEQTNPQEIGSFRDINSLGTLGTYLLERGGEQVPNLAFSLLTGGVGGAAGKTIATRAAESALAKTAERRIVPWATTEIAAQKLATSPAGQRMLGSAAFSGGTKGAVAGAYLGSYALNAPEIFQNIYQETGDLAPATSLLFGGVAAALDSILPVKLTKPQSAAVTLKLLQKSGMEPSLLKSVGKEFLKDAGIEGLTEGAQEALSIGAERIIGDNYDALTSKEFDRVLESVIVGGVVGGPLGAASGANRYRTQKNLLTTENERKAAEEQDAERTRQLTGSDTDPGEIQTLTQKIEDLTQTIGANPNDKLSQFDLKEAKDQLKAAQLELRRLAIPRERREEYDEALKESEKAQRNVKQKPEIKEDESTVSATLNKLGIDRKDVGKMLAALKEQNIDLKLGIKEAPVGSNAEAFRTFLQIFPAANREQAQAIQEYLDTHPAMQDDFITSGKQTEEQESFNNIKRGKGAKAYVDKLFENADTTDPDFYNSLMEVAGRGNSAIAREIDTRINGNEDLKAIRAALNPSGPTAASTPPAPVDPLTVSAPFLINKVISERIAGRELGKEVYDDLMVFRQQAEGVGNTALVAAIDTRINRNTPLRQAAKAVTAPASEEVAPVEPADPLKETRIGIIRNNITALINGREGQEVYDDLMAYRQQAEAVGNTDLVNAINTRINNTKTLRDLAKAQAAANVPATGEVPAVGETQTTETLAAGETPAVGETQTTEAPTAGETSTTETPADLEEARKEHEEIKKQIFEAVNSNGAAKSQWESARDSDPTIIAWDSLDPIARHEFTNLINNFLKSDSTLDTQDIEPAIQDINEESLLRQGTLEDFYNSVAKTGDVPFNQILSSDLGLWEAIRKDKLYGEKEQLANKEIDRLDNLFNRDRELSQKLDVDVRYSKGEDKSSLEERANKLLERQTENKIEALKEKPQGSILDNLGLKSIEEDWEFANPGVPISKANPQELSKFIAKRQAKAYTAFQKRAEKAVSHYIAMEQSPDLGKEAALNHLAGDIAAASGDSTEGRLGKINSPEFGFKVADFGSESGEGRASGREDWQEETARLEEKIAQLEERLKLSPNNTYISSELSQAKKDLDKVSPYVSPEENTDQLIQEHFKYTGGKYGFAYYNYSLSEEDKATVRERAKNILRTEIKYEQIVRHLAAKAKAAQEAEDKLNEKRTKENTRALNKALKEVNQAIREAKKAGQTPLFATGQDFSTRVNDAIYSTLHNLLARTVNKFATHPSEQDKTFYFSQVKRLYQMLNEFVSENPKYKIEAKKAQDNARELLKGYQPTYNKSTVKRTIYALQTAMRRDVRGSRIHVFSTPEESGIPGIASNAKAVVITSKSNPNDFQVYMFANNIQEGDELAVFLHEVGGHVGMRKLVGEANYKFLVNQVKKWAGKEYINSKGEFEFSRWSKDWLGRKMDVTYDDTITRGGKDKLEEIIARSAIQRVHNANRNQTMSEEEFNDELLAHFIEEAILAGVSPDIEMLKSTRPDIGFDHEGKARSEGSEPSELLNVFFKKIVFAIKNLLNKFNIPFVKFKAEDIVNLAYGAAHIELDEQVLSDTDYKRGIKEEVDRELWNDNRPIPPKSSKKKAEEKVLDAKEQRLELIRQASENYMERVREANRAQENVIGEEVSLTSRDDANSFADKLDSPMAETAEDEYEANQNDYEMRYSLSPQVASNLPNVISAVYGHMNAATRNAPTWGKEFIAGANNKLSMLPVTSRSMFNSVLSVNQLAEVTEEYNKKLAAKIKQVDVVTNQRDYEEAVAKEKLGKMLARLQKIYKDAPANIAEEFEEVSHDSTRYQIDFRDTNNAKHPLYKRFYALPKPMQDIYFDVVDQYSEWADAYLKTLDSLTDGALSTKMKLLREQMAKRIVPYLPLYREGDFWLTYTDKNNEPQSIAYMTPAEQKVGKADILKSNDVKPGTTIREHAKFDDITIKSAPPTGEFEKIIKLMRDNKVDPKVQDAVYRTWLDLFPSRSIRQQFRKRKGTGGERQDVLRNLATVGAKMITSAAQMKHSRELNSLFTEIEDIANRDGSVPAQLAAKSMEGRKEGILTPSANVWASRAGYSNYVMYILASVGSAMMNLTALPLITYSLLGGKYGVDRAARAMMEATKMVFSGGWDNSDISFYGDKAKKSALFKWEYADLAQQALGRRRVGRTAAEDLLGRRGVSTSDYSGIRYQVEKKLGWIFQNSERFNREVTLLAAYKLAKAKGMTHNEAVEEAMNMVDLANGGANSETGAALFQRDWGKVIGTFKRYPLTMIYLQYKLFKKAFGKASQKEQEIARAQLLSMYATAGMFAGVKGMPLVGAATFLAQLLNGLFGDKDDPVDPDAELMRVLGFPLYNGPIGYALNIDFSRAGLSNLVWKDNPQRLEKVGLPTFVLETALGPTMSTAMSVPRAYEFAAKGEWQKAFEAVSPAFLRNFSKGIRIADEGITNAAGMKIKDVSRLDAFKQAFGITPNEVKQMYDQNQALNMYQNAINARQTSILARLNAAIDNQDLDEQIELEDVIDKFNMSDWVQNNPSEKIDYKMKEKSRKSHLSRMEDAVNGVYLDKKTRDYVYGLYGDTSVGSLFR